MLFLCFSVFLSNSRVVVFCVCARSKRCHVWSIYFFFSVRVFFVFKIQRRGHGLLFVHLVFFISLPPPPFICVFIYFFLVLFLLCEVMTGKLLPSLRPKWSAVFPSYPSPQRKKKKLIEKKKLVTVFATLFTPCVL